MTIEPGKHYRLNPKGFSSRKYFRDKYGTATPTIRIEGRDTDLWPGSNWAKMADQRNWAAFLFWQRLLDDGIHLPDGTPAWGGQIESPDGIGLSEIVLTDELEAL